MSVSAHIAAQRTDHGVPHAVSCRANYYQQIERSSIEHYVHATARPGPRKDDYRRGGCVAVVGRR